MSKCTEQQSLMLTAFLLQKVSNLLGILYGSHGRNQKAPAYITVANALTRDASRQLIFSMSSKPSVVVI